MSDSKDMETILKENYDESLKIIEDNIIFEKVKKEDRENIKWIQYILSLQYDLMVDIIKKRDLSNMETKRMLSNLILSIVDEVNEFNEYFDKLQSIESNTGVKTTTFGNILEHYNSEIDLYEITNKLKRKLKFNSYINSIYELIDIIHFIVQIQLISMSIISSIEDFDGDLLETMSLEFFDNDIVRNKVLLDTYKKILEISPILNDKYMSGSLLPDVFENVNEDLIIETTITSENFTTRMVYFISKMLENIEWKHWKTYDKDEEIIIEKNTKLFMYSSSMLFYIIRMLREIFGMNMKDITLIYISKNIENFDRQKRNY